MCSSLYTSTFRDGIQALERAQPVPSMTLGRIEGRTNDCSRRGTTSPFAVLEVATDEITHDCSARERHHEFPAFLEEPDFAPIDSLNVPCRSGCTPPARHRPATHVCDTSRPSNRLRNLVISRLQQCGSTISAGLLSLESDQMGDCTDAGTCFPGFGKLHTNQR